MKFITNKNCVIIFIFGCILLLLMHFLPMNYDFYELFKKNISFQIVITLFVVIFGFLSPIIAFILRPKYLFLPSILLFLYLTSLLSADGGVVFGNLSYSEQIRSYGWPLKFMKIHYHKGGKYIKNEAKFQEEWKPDNNYKIKNVKINWLKLFPNIFVNIIFAYICTLPMKLIKNKKSKYQFQDS